MKKLLVLLLVLALCIPCFAACDAKEDEDAGESTIIERHEVVDGELIITYTDGRVVSAGTMAEPQGTAGLEYSPLPDGTYAVSVGTAKYLEEIVIPATYQGKAVTVVLEEAFNDASNMKSITIPNTITSIGAGAFGGCSGLTDVNIPDSVTIIGENAFWGCDSLTSVTIGAGVTSIGYETLNIPSLVDINVSPNNAVYTSIEGNLYNKDATALIQYASGKTNTTFIIPEGVKEIWSDAFHVVNLNCVVIPSTITAIYAYAFYFCENINSLIYTGTQAQWSAIAKGSNWSINPYYNPSNTYTVNCTDGVVSGIVTAE